MLERPAQFDAQIVQHVVKPMPDLSAPNENDLTQELRVAVVGKRNREGVPLPRIVNAEGNIDGFGIKPISRLAHANLTTGAPLCFQSQTYQLHL